MKINSFVIFLVLLPAAVAFSQENAELKGRF